VGALDTVLFRGGASQPRALVSFQWLDVCKRSLLQLGAFVPLGKNHWLPLGKNHWLGGDILWPVDECRSWLIGCWSVTRQFVKRRAEPARIRGIAKEECTLSAAPFTHDEGRLPWLAEQGDVNPCGGQRWSWLDGVDSAVPSKDVQAVVRGFKKMRVPFRLSGRQRLGYLGRQLAFVSNHVMIRNGFNDEVVHSGHGASTELAKQ
jgi:hypothetical protein